MTKLTILFSDLNENYRKTSENLQKSYKILKFLTFF